MISEQIAEYWLAVKAKVDTTELRKLETLLNKVASQKITNNHKIVKSEQTVVKAANAENQALKENLKLQRERLTMDRYHGQGLEMNKRFEERSRKAAERERKVQEVHEAKMNNLRNGGGRGGRSPLSNAMGGRGNVGVAWHGALAGAGVLSGFGLRALNQKIQELEMLPIMLEGVTGSQQRAQSELAFTKRLGAETGITQTDMVPDYTKLLAASLKTPMEGTVQQGFTNFVKYSKVMGLDQERTKLSLRALTQIANKGTLMSEEVKGQ